MTKCYDEIRKQYPETISKDQFYRIAHISKATALYLLQSGLVHCIDSGKKTRRYTIRMDDVIFYMIDREKHPEVYQAPVNWYKKRSGKKRSSADCYRELSELSLRALKDRKAFGEKFQSMDEYKKERNFKRLLENLTLQDVKDAIQRAEEIQEINICQDNKQNYRDFEYYSNNPSLSIHEHIKKILQECGVM